MTVHIEQKLKATPGPWRVVIDDSGDRPVAVPSIQAAEEYDCAIVHWDGFWQEHWQSARGNKEMHANAHLIAASPALYAMVAKAAAQFRYYEQSHRAKGTPDADAKADVNAALAAECETLLAQARGETA